MTPKLFSELGLSAEVLKAIDKLGFEQAAPIQAEAIPVLMQGRDVVGQSQTGSGKTAAFAIPAIEKTDPHQRAVQVLILCPTRELAVQVSEEVHKLALFKRGIHALPIYGGQSYERQFYGLKQGANIIIGTPGRVMDHMRRGTLDLGAVRMVVLDEADVMLDMGFREDIEFILQAIPAERQTVFFSATMPRPIQDLIGKYAREPQSVRIEQKAMTVPTVEQVYYEVDRRFKIELLTRLIDIHDLKLGIIFCNTKRMVDDLVDHLEAQGYSADRLHGDMSQVQRDRVMHKFRKSALEFLVATDVAARGIDVEDVQVVFNYDLPYDVEDYVHRIGRTGRAGRSGRAISFVAGREVFQIRNIERFANTRIHRAKVPTLAEVEDARAGVVVEKLRATLQSGQFKRQDHLLDRLLEEGFSSTDIASALLHHLQGGDGPAPAGVPTTARQSRPERAPFAPARRPREDRGPRHEPERRALLDSIPPPKPPPHPAGGHPLPHRGRGQGEAVAGDREVHEEDVRRTGKGVRPFMAGEEVRREQGASHEPRPATPAPADRLPQHRESPVPDDRSPAQPTEAQDHAASPAPPPAVEPEDRPRGFRERRERIVPERVRSPQHSRATPGGQTRLFISIGTEMGVAAADIVRAIQGETGLPATAIGTVDLRDRHLFVDVASENANSIISKLNRSRIQGHKVKVKLA